MAKLYGLDNLNDFNPKNLINFTSIFARSAGQPLDKTAIWYPAYVDTTDNWKVVLSTHENAVHKNGLERATQYATTPAAYVGQILTVVSEEAAPRVKLTVTLPEVIDDETGDVLDAEKTVVYYVEATEVQEVNSLKLLKLFTTRTGEVANENPYNTGDFYIGLADTTGPSALAGIDIVGIDIAGRFGVHHGTPEYSTVLTLDSDKSTTTVSYYTYKFNGTDYTVILDNTPVNVATAYVIDNEDGDLKEVGSSPVGDDTTISVDETGKISVIINGKVESSNAGLVTGGQVYTAIKDINDKIGDIPTENKNGQQVPAATDVIDYINKKTQGIATDAALDELQTAVDILEETIKGKAAQGNEGDEDYQPAVPGLEDKLEDVIKEVSEKAAAEHSHADYIITCTDATENIGTNIKRHVLKQGNTTVCTIDIPKDLVVESGSVYTYYPFNKYSLETGKFYFEQQDLNGNIITTEYTTVTADASGSECDWLYLPSKDATENVSIGTNQHAAAFAYENNIWVCKGTHDDLLAETDFNFESFTNDEFYQFIVDEYQGKFFFAKKDILPGSPDYKFCTKPEAYLVLNIANVDEPIMIPAGSLIEYVTSGSATGDMVVVSIDHQHKVTATITDGTITKAKLAQDVIASLTKAESAVQPVDIKNFKTQQVEKTYTGSTAETVTSVTQNKNGEISVTYGDIEIGADKVLTSIKRPNEDNNYYVAATVNEALEDLAYGINKSKADSINNTLAIITQSEQLETDLADFPIPVAELDIFGNGQPVLTTIPNKCITSQQLISKDKTYKLTIYWADSLGYILESEEYTATAEEADFGVVNVEFDTHDGTGGFVGSILVSSGSDIQAGAFGTQIDFRSGGSPSFEDENAKYKTARIKLTEISTVGLGIEAGAQVNAISTVSSNFKITKENKKLELVSINSTNTTIENTATSATNGKDLTLLQFVTQLVNQQIDTLAAPDIHEHTVLDIVGLKTYIEDAGYTFGIPVYEGIAFDVTHPGIIEVFADTTAVDPDIYDNLSSNTQFHVETPSLSLNTAILEDKLYAIVIRDSAESSISGCYYWKTSNIFEDSKIYESIEAIGTGSNTTPWLISAHNNGTTIVIESCEGDALLVEKDDYDIVRNKHIEIVPIIQNLNLKAVATTSNTGLVKSTAATQYNTQGIIIDTEDNKNTINKVNVGADGTMTVNAISVNKIENNGYTLVLFGGNATAN